MGLDVVPTSATIFAAAALVHTVRSRRRSSDRQMDKVSRDWEGTQGDQYRLISREARQQIALKEHAEFAKEELGRTWMYRPEIRDEVTGYFNMLADPKWKLQSVSRDLEVWRLPGEDVHRIMGVSTVDAHPDTCMEYFKDPRMVFTKLFPNIDRMFTHGKVLQVQSKDKALCHANFKMPMPVGNMPARGIRSRDFVWRQTVSKLSTGNVLVTASSTNEIAVPEQKGVVRGEIRTSGYYGRRIPGKEASRVWYIVQADPKGFLPKWLVNLASQKQAQNALRLSEMFQNGKP